MKPTPEQIKKINHFSQVKLENCQKIADVVEIQSCKPGNHLFKEGDRGDTMILVFQGQVEVSKEMMVKTSSGFTTSRKSIIRLETTDPKPESRPETESTVLLLKRPLLELENFLLF